MSSKNKPNNALFYGVIIVIALIAVFAIFILTQKPSAPSDFTVKNFKYEDKYFSGSPPVSWDTSAEKINEEFTFTISTTGNNLYYRVYQSSTGVDLTGFSISLSAGDTEAYVYNYKASYLSEQPKIEICVSGDYNFDKSSPSTVCQIEMFDAPRIDVSITPNPLTFTESKSAYNYEGDYKTIRITNIGDITLEPSVFLPWRATPGYPANYPGYMTKETSGHTIQPGESFDYSISPDSYDALGTFTSTGYVAALLKSTAFDSALYKKEFSLVTTVNP